MATYVFRCTGCPDRPVFEVVRSITEPTSGQACPGCGRAAVRVFTPPALGTTSPGLHRAVDAAAASAEAPQVVSSVPAGAPRPAARRWHPSTGAAPVHAASRPAGPHPPLPRG